MFDMLGYSFDFAVYSDWDSVPDSGVIHNVYDYNTNTYGSLTITDYNHDWTSDEMDFFSYAGPAFNWTSR